MRSLTRVRVFVGGGFLLSGLLAILGSMVGCSGDNSSDGGDADAANDVTIDNNPPDAINDTGPDVIADAGPDVYDASALLAFPETQLTTFCKRLQTCCFNGADAGTLSGCLAQVSPGIEGNLSDTYGVIDGGNLRLNQTAATSCLAGLSVMTCGILNDIDGGSTAISASEYSTIVQNCYNAIYGTIPIGQEGCLATVECVPGAYCAPATGADGGATHKCVATLGEGQGPCNTKSNYECEYRGYVGDAGLTCETTDAGAECVPKLGNNADCTYSFECSSGLCNQYANPSCGTSAPVVDFPFTCDALFGIDGG